MSGGQCDYRSRVCTFGLPARTVQTGDAIAAEQQRIFGTS